MKYLTTIPKTARRAAAVIAVASAAGLIAISAAVAAGSSGAVLVADTSRTAPAAVRACTASRSRSAWAHTAANPARYESAGSSTNTGISRVVRCWYSAYGG